MDLLFCPSHVPCQHCQMTAMGAKCSHSTQPCTRNDPWPSGAVTNSSDGISITTITSGPATELLLPELGVDLQGLGEHLGPRVPHGVATDVQGHEAGVTAQGTQQHVGSQLEA